MYRIGGSTGCPVVGMALICEIVFRWRRVFRDGKIRSGRRGAEAVELMQCAVEGPFDPGFVARKSFDGTGTGSVIGESAGAGVESRCVLVPGQLRDTNAEQTGFEGAHAAQAPGGHGHLLDKKGFSGSGGLVFVEKGAGQFLELAGGFVGEDGGLGG